MTHRSLFWLQLGLALFFLASGLMAWLKPDEFRELLSTSVFSTWLTDPGQLVWLIRVNDLVLFGLLVSGRWPRVTALWAAGWILGVMSVTGFFSFDAVEHLGVLALIVAYATATSVDAAVHQADSPTSAPIEATNRT